MRLAGRSAPSIEMADEAVPAVEVPARAAQWIPYAVRLLQAGWEIADVAKEMGYGKRNFHWSFNRIGLDARTRFDVMPKGAQQGCFTRTDTTAHRSPKIIEVDWRSADRWTRIDRTYTDKTTLNPLGNNGSSSRCGRRTRVAFRRENYLYHEHLASSGGYFFANYAASAEPEETAGNRHRAGGYMTPTGQNRTNTSKEKTPMTDTEQPNCRSLVRRPAASPSFSGSPRRRISLGRPEADSDVPHRADDLRSPKHARRQDRRARGGRPLGAE